MTKYRALAAATRFWKPGENYLKIITAAIEAKVDDGDFLIVSEKAISTALGRILDESTVQPSLNAKLIARLWMRIAWGYLLGVICHFGQRLLRRLREYPLETGSRHKQVALEHAGVLQALMFGSEGGIDGSNLPYSFVSLPLSDASEVAEQIQRHVLRTLGKRVCVVIVDTDKTYTFRNFHFTPRPRPMKGIHSAAGFTTYIFGRAFRLKRSSTPLAVAGCRLQAAEALEIANIADRVRGPGSGATVWDMAARFSVSVTGVSWEMLARLEHKPIVLVRLKKSKG
ncbi:gamma-glutamyl ligase [Candidatus Bathyarchaeota archaeon A05DMB-2]|jgi:F420-0:gamma-glutamyl ligase-like protein|nr:gamma-glutamyl ligase [Candidatus Bathyarchaeota archaeon A05DMB-2]